MASGLFARKRGRNDASPVACIFVHAGAGYHSAQNEQIHLKACHDACKAAMVLLQNGGSAVDAVEMAIKILEDREVTNAGYGSNLTIDGVVECDAIVVDHRGRSGAVGAVAQIKNPITLARLVLDHTSESLSLKRVPPNLLVGQGASNFAYEHNMPVIPIDFLISPGARSRWLRWRRELQKFEDGHRQRDTDQHGGLPSPLFYETSESRRDRLDSEQLRQKHTQAMLACVWNEAQPFSPPPTQNSPFATPPSAPHLSDRAMEDFSKIYSVSVDPDGPPIGDYYGLQRQSSSSTDSSEPDEGYQRSHSLTSGMHMTNASTELDPDSSLRYPSPIDVDLNIQNSSTLETDARLYAQHVLSDLHSGEIPHPTPESLPNARIEDDIPIAEAVGINSLDPESTSHKPLADGSQLPERTEDEDLITDTVGAIAVDMLGNIACGASSGGIGMKHRGRVGPAALLGIGAAVIPLESDDPDGTTIATVTSGTGEHIGTTMAASVCNDRVYQNLRRTTRMHYEECSDDEAIQGFITKDFMDHPSVKYSSSAGAIGVLTVKKTFDGIYLYFAHNTDSFALASMHSNENKPACTMSRILSKGNHASGGRAIRIPRKASWRSKPDV